LSLNSTTTKTTTQIPKTFQTVSLIRNAGAKENATATVISKGYSTQIDKKQNTTIQRQLSSSHLAATKMNKKKSVKRKVKKTASFNNTHQVNELAMPCQDFNEKFCSFFAKKREYCRDVFYANGLPMPIVCAKSCNTCPTRGSAGNKEPIKGGCVDYDSRICSSMTTAAFCNKDYYANGKPLIEACCLSCKKIVKKT
jgi:hypothetical protein